MSKSPSPDSNYGTFFKFLSLILPLMTLAGTIACGGGTSNAPVGGGGGGGGGGTSANCSQPLPLAISPKAQIGLGQTVPSDFMDLHLGSSDLPWPTVPFGGLRLWDTATGWAQINSADGVYDWTNLDGFVTESQTHGVDLLYNLARTPTWASSNQTDSTCSYDTDTQGGPGQCDPPNDLNSDGSGTDQHWINWVSAVASRYKGEIKYYEIWNEWNAATFWNPTPPGNTTPANAAELVRMEQDARCVIEGPPTGLNCNPNSTFPSGTAIDPSAKIVTPSPVGTASTLSAVQDNLTTYFTTQVNGYFGGQFADVIGFHGYESTGKSGICPIPEDVITVIDDMNSAITTAGESGKPWFDTEDGWSKAADEDFLDQDREAAFLARYYLLQWSMGVNRSYWYRWDSTDAYAGALWSASGGPIEAVTAWNEISKWMVGATLSTPCTLSGTIWTCGFTRGSYQAVAVWDSAQDCVNGACSTSTYTIPASVTYTMYRDLTGAENTVSGGTVLIGAKPILLETGALPPS